MYMAKKVHPVEAEFIQHIQRCGTTNVLKMEFLTVTLSQGNVFQ